MRHTFQSFHPQAPDAVLSSPPPPLLPDRPFPDFAINPQARHCTWPKRVRHPTDRLFASGCSPPGLSADAVTFSYEAVVRLDTDFHRANVAPSRAHGLRCANPTYELRAPTYEAGWIRCDFRRSAASARSTFFNTLPVELRGKAPTKNTYFDFL